MPKLSDFVKPLNSPSTQFIAAAPDTHQTITNYTALNNVELTLIYAMPSSSSPGIYMNGVQLSGMPGYSGTDFNVMVFQLGVGQTLTIDNGNGPTWGKYILTGKKID